MATNDFCGNVLTVPLSGKWDHGTQSTLRAAKMGITILSWITAISLCSGTVLNKTGIAMMIARIIQIMMHEVGDTVTVEEEEVVGSMEGTAIMEVEVMRTEEVEQGITSLTVMTMMPVLMTMTRIETVI